MFAAEKILKNQTVWVYDPLVDIAYTDEQWNRLRESIAPSAWERLYRYSYTLRGKNIVELDGAQFINHSRHNYNIASESADSEEVYATRDIEQGEEILSNYLLFCTEDELSFEDKS